MLTLVTPLDIAHVKINRLFNCWLTSEMLTVVTPLGFALVRVNRLSLPLVLIVGLQHKCLQQLHLSALHFYKLIVYRYC